MAVSWELDNGTIFTPFKYCYYPTDVAAGGMMRQYDLKFYALPVLLWQVVLVLFVARVLTFLLKPIRQPRVVAEIITGIIVGPTVLAKIKITTPQNINGVIEYTETTAGEILFPTQSFKQIDCMGYLGLLFFLFLVGVEFDVKLVTQARKKVFAIATTSMLLPFGIATLVGLAMNLKAPNHVYYLTYIIFLGAAMAVTAFPVLVRLLSELKLLNSEIGQVVLPSAIIADMMAWVFLVLSVIIPGKQEVDGEGMHIDGAMKLASLWIILSGLAFILVCWLVFRPIMCWMVRRTPEGEPVSDIFLVSIVIMVLAAGLATDAIGFHAVFGAFVFGLMVPQGPLTDAMRDKIGEFVVNIILPVFFASSGFKTDLSLIAVHTKEDAKILVALVLMSLFTLAVKVGSSALIAQYYSIPVPHGLSIGLLMSVKGPIEMIILNIGNQKQVFDVRTYTILVLASVLTTSSVAPLVTMLNKSNRIRISYKRRNLQRSRPDMELRMLACVHTARNVPSIISLLQMSNPTKRSPIFVYALQLLELTGRASAMLIVHEAGKKRDSKRVGGGTASSTMVHSEQIIAAFENYEQHAGGVSVQQLTTISPYSTMHEDIFNIAEERHATMIILPFHKMMTVAGDFEDTNPAIRSVNQSVLANPPCTIGILVDRGLNRTGRFTVGQQMSHNVAMLFFGGPDDREALTYCWRLAENPGINLTVVRFIPGEEVMIPPSPVPSCDEGSMTAIPEVDMQRDLDDDCVNQFRLRYVSEETVMYTEKIINNTEDTVAAIRAMNKSHSMYVVGKGQGMESSPLLVGLMEWTEYPELGPIGDMLVSPDFGEAVSVLVVQQYLSMEVGGGGMSEMPLQPESPRPAGVQRYLNNAYHKARHGAGFNSGWNG
ncbi:hypothetical protein Cni_G25638 [Canna indica]|uniref:Cation/H+ exchanger domain-containing protein n=1 Tax=Canna indica TaxID=4628 RepID=A0AAQ3KYA5_9LILI|nr:hypothetical protein Cni_G25638 [Canna indica]